jgi:dTDP-4-dehydrorhamnose 3,5-epimerase-like enzyme
MAHLSILTRVTARTFPESNATLSAVELENQVPFSVRRIYYISGANQKTIRGQHAHKNLNQVFFATSGAFSLKVHDGLVEENVRISSHGDGYLVPPGVWRSLENWTEDAVCLVLASHAYDCNDYIRDFSAFISWKEELRK